MVVGTLCSFGVLEDIEKLSVRRASRAVCGETPAEAQNPNSGTTKLREREDQLPWKSLQPRRRSSGLLEASGLSGLKGLGFRGSGGLGV